MKFFSRNWKILAVFLWLIFTLSFALWWMIFSLRLVNHLAASYSDQYDRHKHMLIVEGVSWMVLLLAGGLTLIYFVLKERRQAEQFRNFVASFSHDLKTSLASLQLQVESLKEDLAGTPHSPLLERLHGDATRLQLQLENSLYLAQKSDSRLFLENLSLDQVVARLQHQWPLVKFTLTGQCTVRADRRAFESVLKNLVQNAVVHGGATEIGIRCSRHAANKVQIIVHDNGSGFGGNWDELGQIFYRHNPSSGSGVGLYIVKRLLDQMEGLIEFNSQCQQGFEVQLALEGSAQ